MKRESDGRRQGGRVARALIGAALLCLSAAPTALGSNSVYWTNYGATKLSFAGLDGSGGGDLATGTATVTMPFGTAIDAAAGRIYWANYGANKISFARLDGSGGGDVPTGSATVNQPAGVAVDPAAGRIYWANYAASKISFANLDGSGGGDLATGGATVLSPMGVAIDPAAGRIYWANYNGGKISFARLDGTGGGDVPTGSATVSGPMGVAVDPAAGRVYWATYIGGTISFANLNGTGGGDINTNGATVSHPEGVAIDPTSGRIYWGNYTGNKISYTRLDGTGGADLPTAGATTNGPTYPAILDAPSPAGAPAISGGSAVGSTLSCSQGSWAPDLLSQFLYRAPASFGHQWSLNGADIAGASQASILVSAPGDYRCRVTATNHAGSSSQTSDAHAVLAALTVSVSGSGKVTGVGISCPRDCTEAYAAGTAVTLSARAASGSRFSGWSGACSGTRPCRLTMSANRTVSARFKLLRPNTRIAKASIASAKRKASFRFKAVGKATRYQCALERGRKKARFKRCRSPKTYKHLNVGKYTFEVRAIGRAGTDRSPAKRAFRIT